MTAFGDIVSLPAVAHPGHEAHLALPGARIQPLPEPDSRVGHDGSGCGAFTLSQDTALPSGLAQTSSLRRLQCACAGSTHLPVTCFPRHRNGGKSEPVRTGKALEATVGPFVRRGDGP